MDYDSFLRSSAWRNSGARRQEFEAAGFRCRVCNDAAPLEGHHRTYERFGGAEQPSDILAVCRPCHGAITSHLRARKHARRAVAGRDIDRPIAEPSPLFDPERDGGCHGA